MEQPTKSTLCFSTLLNFIRPPSLILALLASGLTTAFAAEIPLNKLDITLISCGWGTPQADQAVTKKPISIGKQVFDRGLGVHAPSTGMIQLDGKAEAFRALVGVDDASGGGHLSFAVKGDGKVLWESGPMRMGEKAKVVNVPLQGIQRLTLEVDALGSPDYDHANWAEAVIAYSGATPKMRDMLSPYAPAELYPPTDALKASPGNTTYFVDPAKGDDVQAGTAEGKAWKSIAKVNALKLAPGDMVVIAPGTHSETLKPSGEGTEAKPIVIQFQAGVHAFASGNLYSRPYYVSNSCDRPKHPLPIGIFIENAKHLRFQGAGVEGLNQTKILLTGPDRSTYFINDHAENITFTGLAFDLNRPTVSEYRVMEVADNSAVIHVAEGSTYQIKDGKFSWIGDIGNGWVMVQLGTPANGRNSRLNQWDPFSSATAEDLGNSPEGRPMVRLSYPSGRHGMELGQAFQFRPVNRDVVSAHNTRSKNITFRNCDFYAFTGMGIVSQFTDGITFDHVRAAPEKGTLRVCPAWGDMFHFSGCRGQIMVNDCVFSGAQDDPINVHGTHLRILKKAADNQLLLRFMQPQTYGIAAFAPGDEVAVIGHGTLRELPGNPRRKVAAIAPDPSDPAGHQWLLTLDGPVPTFNENDVVDNLTWYPDVTVKNCTVDMDSCRGFLITTRGKAVIENNTFTRCHMPSILVEGDAEGWFESGPIRDLLIRGNTFIASSIEISPHINNSDPAQPVLENIRIENNTFLEGAGISAKSVKGLTITGNRAEKGSKVRVNVAATCTDVKIENND